MSQVAITPHGNVSAAELEAKMAEGGHISAVTSFVPDPKGVGKIYSGDVRDYIEKKEWLIDLTALKARNILGASGKDTSKVKVFSDNFKRMWKVFTDTNKKLEIVKTPYYRVLGGAQAVTDYQTARRSKDLLEVIGVQPTIEDHTAINIVDVRNVTQLKFINHKKTSALMAVQVEIGDEVVPDVARQAFTDQTVEIFADAFHYVFSMRENSDSLFSLDNEIRSELPGAFSLAKDNKITTLANAVSGTNQGDWDAVTGNFYDVDAAADVQAAEDAVKTYGRPLTGLMPSDSWRAYIKNMQGVPITPSGTGAKSTSAPGAKQFNPVGNPGVSMWINDDITPATYILNSVKSWARFFRGPVIQTSYKNEKIPGQSEGKIMFDFNGVFQIQAAAAFFGTSVTT